MLSLMGYLRPPVSEMRWSPSWRSLLCVTGQTRRLSSAGFRGALHGKSDDPVGRGILFEFAGRAVAILEFGIFGADAGVCGDGLRDEDVTIDDGAGADERFAAEDGSAGVDGDIIFEGGVSFGAAE